MSILQTLSRSLSAAAIVCSILTVAAPAQAAVVGSFDPAFGPAIPNLGFRGTITFDVTDACYALGSGFHYTGGNCSITARSAQLGFYNATSNPSGTLLSLPLDGATYFPQFYVIGAYYDPTTGQIAGVDTVDSNVFGVTVTDPNPRAPIAYNGNMVLYFQSGFAPTTPPDFIASAASMADPAAAAAPGFGGAYLRNCLRVAEGACFSDSSNTSNVARVTFTVVPEPDGIALAALGLAALIAARRRRR